MTERTRWLGILALAALLIWSKSGGGVPSIIAPQATAVTYVYEKSGGPIPPAVMAGLNRLNREKKIRATTFDADTVDGSGETPDQYRAAKAAADQAGLPCLVVTAGDKVVRVVKGVQTVEHVLESVP